MYNVIVEGKGNIVAKIVADSINKQGNRITTFELKYHRFIHSELMTHRLFSRNAMSSRAVPIKKMIEQVRNNPATPIHWGQNQAGMQAKGELCGVDKYGNDLVQLLTARWKESAKMQASFAQEFSDHGLHKQVVNRILEPFQMMKTVLTATEFDNFFWLRCDADAQPEIQELANCMFVAMKQSEPEYLEEGEWHTPYVEHVLKGGKFAGYCLTDGDEVTKLLSEQEALAISASCCAQVSYRVLNNTYEKAMDIYNKLASGRKVHASPFEHQATPMGTSPSHEDGVTHKDNIGCYWSGNFKGWIQHRQTLDNHACWDYSE